MIATAKPLTTKDTEEHEGGKPRGSEPFARRNLQSEIVLQGRINAFAFPIPAMTLDVGDYGDSQLLRVLCG